MSLFPSGGNWELFSGRISQTDIGLNGRVVSIKAVDLALPTYSMNVFKLQASLCKEIESLMAHFWWGGDDTKNKIHWKSWDILCLPKALGGLGFKHLVKIFKQMLLAKQCWHLITSPTSLATQVLKGEYIPLSSYANAKVKNLASFLWRSFL